LNGYKYDAAGYQSCDCACNPMNCLIACPDGYEVDGDGCKTCNCIRKYDTCPKVDCILGCAFYTQVSGCLDCKCDPQPTCPALLCATKCAYGTLYNEKGCPTCDCEPCPPVTCPRYCPYGFTKEISTGCPKCICAEKPTCPNGGFAGDSLSVPNNCPLKCLKGYELDKTGCPTCVCLPVPVCTCGVRSTEEIKCGDGKTYDRYSFFCKPDVNNKCSYVENKCPIIVGYTVPAGVKLTDAEKEVLKADVKAKFSLPDADVKIVEVSNTDGSTTYKLIVSSDAIPVDKKPEDVRDQASLSLKATGKGGEAYLIDSNAPQNSFGSILFVPILGIFSMLFL